MITTIVSFIFILGILVIVHELGHFLAAKKLGIRVEIFSIGLGPRVWGLRRGETEYRLSLFPLGGFVKMTKEPPKKNFERYSPHFCERPPIDKIIVTLAGPVANILFAFILFSGIYFIGIKEPAFLNKPPIIGWINPSSPAHLAGLKLEDRILAVNETPVSTWKDMSNTLVLHSGQPLVLKVNRGSETIEVTLSLGNTRDVGFYPKETVRIGSVVKSSPAEIAGLQPGDEILTIKQQPIFNWNQLLYILSKEDTHTLNLGVLRGREILTIEVHTEMEKKVGKRYIGIAYQPEEEIIRYSLPNALKQGILKVKENIVLTLQVLRKLITRELSINVLGGPIMIAKASGDVAQIGLIPLLSFMAFLSIQLGFVNLLPFLPIVDGGQVTFYIFEIIRQRPIQIFTIEWAAKIGWAAMILLVLVITYNDIMRLL